MRHPSVLLMIVAACSLAFAKPLQAQTVACPTGFNLPVNSVCTAPLYTPYQYVGLPSGAVYGDLGSAEANEVALIAASPGV